MRLSVNFYLVFTTLLLVSLVIFGALGASYFWMFPLTVFGQFFLLLMVYRILTDDYTTDKTFDDFYEDRPIRE